MTNEEETGALSLGLLVGGSTPENLAWQKAIKYLLLRFHKAKEGVDTPLKLNVVFHVPGNLMKPDFEGVRTGRYSKRDAMLMVQVAVPEVVSSDPSNYVKKAINTAIDEAVLWAAKRKVPIDALKLRKILERV